MKRSIRMMMAAGAVAGVLLAAGPLEAQDGGPTTRQVKAELRPRIEVCFVLDTTGSMSGLIEGAKQKIWSIANDLIAREPRPQIRFALVGYRDRGDAYITQIHGLSEDIDAVFANLKSFRADGGGDTPESVNQALHEAVHKIEWSAGRDVLKIIFLVGDAPPHTDYPNDVQVDEICRQAVKKDLIINTVQCGSASQTREVWQAIAKAAEGSFIALGQEGDMTIAATPFDDELAAASRELNSTVIAYGDARQQKEVASKVAAATEAAAPVAADRAAYNLKADGVAIQGSGDLVADVALGRVGLDEIKPESLPEPLRNLSSEERAKLIAANQAKREELNKKIAELTAQRDAHLEQERQRRAAEGVKDGFDAEVTRIITEQAARKTGAD